VSTPVRILPFGPITSTLPVATVALMTRTFALPAEGRRQIVVHRQQRVFALILSSRHNRVMSSRAQALRCSWRWAWPVLWPAGSSLNSCRSAGSSTYWVTSLYGDVGEYLGVAEQKVDTVIAGNGLNKTGPRPYHAAKRPAQMQPSNPTQGFGWTSPLWSYPYKAVSSTDRARLTFRMLVMEHPFNPKIFAGPAGISGNSNGNFPFFCKVEQAKIAEGWHQALVC